MRQAILYTVAVAALVSLGACSETGDGAVRDAMKEVNVVDATDLNDVMLTVADPNEAVAYFARASSQDPGRIDLMRGLAKSLVRASRATEAVAAWKDVVAHPEATNDDHVSYADALIRANMWDEAEAVLDQVPPTVETFDRYRLEAMVADANKEWSRADSFYETAVGLTIRPAPVLNNWGFSKLTRGDFQGAERLFYDAIRHDPQMFTAKNNLMLARGAQRKYDMPVIPMTQVERAELLYTLALTAIKQNDVAIGKTLLQEAINTHPQHFDEAVRSLAALEQNVNN